MYEFNEKTINEKLDKLPWTEAIAFPLAACYRLANIFKNDTDVFYKARGETLIYNIETIRNFADKGEVLNDLLEKSIVDLDSLNANETFFWKLKDAVLENAITSLMYVLRYLANKKTQEIAWSARHAYEAADQIANKQLKTLNILENYEHRMLQSTVVQCELFRQNRDIDLLLQNKKSEIFNFATFEELCIKSEFNLE